MHWHNVTISGKERLLKPELGHTFVLVSVFTTEFCLENQVRAHIPTNAGIYLPTSFSFKCIHYQKVFSQNFADGKQWKPPQQKSGAKKLSAAEQNG